MEKRKQLFQEEEATCHEYEDATDQVYDNEEDLEDISEATDQVYDNEEDLEDISETTDQVYDNEEDLEDISEKLDERLNQTLAQKQLIEHTVVSYLFAEKKRTGEFRVLEVAMHGPSCLVCTEPYTQNDKVVSFAACSPPCNFECHSQCLKTWFETCLSDNRQPSCPDAMCTAKMTILPFDDQEGDQDFYYV